MTLTVCFFSSLLMIIHVAQKPKKLIFDLSSCSKLLLGSLNLL